MTRDIEKNDVDIAQLFKWSKVVVIEDNMTNQSVTLHLRLVGDADVNRARTRALRDSGELRKKLRDPKSEERVSFVNELQEIKDKETAVSFCILLDLDELQKKAMRDAKPPAKPKEPKSDASLEEQEKYQKKVDAYPVKYAKVVAKELQKLRETEEERLGALTFEEVYEHYETLVISRLCNTQRAPSADRKVRKYEYCQLSISSTTEIVIRARYFLSDLKENLQLFPKSRNRIKNRRKKHQNRGQQHYR